MLMRFKIEKLFGQFNYDIELKPEGITLLTGPNGYGKTTILKILDALASKNGYYLLNLPFERLVLAFADRASIILQRTGSERIEITDGTRVDGGQILDLACIVQFIGEKFSALGLAKQPYDDRWRDSRTERSYNTDTLLQKILSAYPDFLADFSPLNLPGLPRLHFIREQRLLRPVATDLRRQDFLETTLEAFSETIEEYAENLRELIQEMLAKSAQTTQELDSSFPRRLFEQKQAISEKEFQRQFDDIQAVQHSLARFGLFSGQDETQPVYQEENAKALYVYIEDTRRKLEVFEGLLAKLSLFTDILNDRRLTFKYIAISQEHGFSFHDQEGKPLALRDLSSGEQQEVVLLYELLFKVQPGTLVLIDEPEISLHVAWQKQFLDDIEHIVKLQKIAVIIATHSPQIIHNSWDLTVDLEEIAQ